MKKIFFFLVPVFVLLNLSCKENSTGNSTDNLSFEYIGTNNSVYASHSYLVDTLGNVLVEYRETTYVNIYFDTSTIGNYHNSVRVDSRGSVRDSSNKIVRTYNNQNWYVRLNDTLYEIAYKGAGGSYFLKSSSVIAKTHNINFADPFGIIPIAGIKSIQSDSIKLNEARYAVYKLPLALNSEWQCLPLGYPIQRRKKIESQESISTPAGTFSCFKIHASLVSRDFEPDVIWYNYVAREGLILRTIKMDVVITTQENPDSGMKATYYIRLELISKK